MGRPKVAIPKDELHKLYWEEKLSPIKIAVLYKCNPVTVRTRIREHGLATRSKSMAQMRYEKYDFSGDEIEKAYLIGFRLGDLNVYQTSERSELIVVRCNTTQQAQVKLITDLFSSYGKVTLSRGSYSTNINCFLNTSFSFLLPKSTEIPEWLGLNKLTSAAFTAGYIDAEGNFILNQGKARLKIDSYDKEVLHWISNWLNKQGINVKIRRIAKLGDIQKGSMLFNKDLWRLNINDAPSLLRFISIVKPFIKHETRLKHIMICEDNIKQRTLKRTIYNAR